jgi:hypothetical protein
LNKIKQSGANSMKSKKKKRKYKIYKYLTKDAKKILKIMKRNSLSQIKLSKILKTTPSNINGWLCKGNNIKSIYFEKLKKLGY